MGSPHYLTVETVKFAALVSCALNGVVLESSVGRLIPGHTGII